MDLHFYWQRNNWYDGETYYTASYTGDMTQAIQDRNSEILMRMNMAWDTLRSNYFAHLEEKITKAPAGNHCFRQVLLVIE